MKIYEHVCLRCGHGWVSSVERPSQCPRCRSRRWNKNIEEEKSREPKSKKIIEGWKCENCGVWNLPNFVRCKVCYEKKKGTEKTVYIAEK